MKVGMGHQFLSAKNAVLLALVMASAWLIILLSILPPLEAQIITGAPVTPIFMPH